MASLKDLRDRINSVKATQKITKAMQMVAAAKLRRAQSAVTAARPFAEKIDAILTRVASGLTQASDVPKLLSGTGSNQNYLLVVCSSERGLCGGFNSSIVRKAKQHIADLEANGKAVQILCVGRKGYDQLRRDHAKKIIEVIDFKAVKSLSYEQAQQVGDKVLDLFAAGKFDVCTLFYAEFRSVISQIPTAQQIIPAQIPDAHTDTKKSEAVYEFEPDETTILEDLLPRNINVQIFKALLENAASEQGARMSAMDNATRNAGEMINKQTLIYNRTRQAQITKELIEIISGAEAL